MDYKLITSDSPQALADQVNTFLSQGYSLHGNPGAIIGVNGNGHVYFQAVVKSA